MKMKKSIVASFKGKNVKVADLLVNRLLPNPNIAKVGPFVLLDHVYPKKIEKQKTIPYNGQFAHPHRGIATLSYVLSGELEHIDSYNNRGVVSAGGVQWMNAGSGIVHDEHLSSSFLANGGIFHSLQFWINLPAANKKELPAYVFVASEELPEIPLPNEGGAIKILLGKCGDNTSPIRTFSNQFIYHIKLNPKSTFNYSTKAEIEYAVFVPAKSVMVNGESVSNSLLVVLSKDDHAIDIYNPGIEEADVFVFGGEEYTEAHVAEGPFVMNTREEIAHAYADFFAGKYGEIAIQCEVAKKNNFN